MQRRQADVLSEGPQAGASAPEKVARLMYTLSIDQQLLEVWTDRLRVWIASEVLLQLHKRMDRLHTDVASTRRALKLPTTPLPPLCKFEVARCVRVGGRGVAWWGCVALFVGGVQICG